MKRLKMTLTIICILIVLLLGGNIALFIIQQNNTITENELVAKLETLSVDISNYAYPPKDQRSDEDYTKIEKSLESIIDDSKNQDTTTRANILLALLYSYKDDDFSRPLEFLDSVLKNGDVLSDQNEYAILNTKLGFYKEIDDTENIKVTLQEILKFPETMKLPLEDWNATRKYYEKELEELGD